MVRCAGMAVTGLQPNITSCGDAPTLPTTISDVSRKFLF